MVGHIRRVKQTATPETVRDWLNYRMRSIMDMRPFFSGTLKNKVIAVEDPYTTGSITRTFGSQVVVGTDTAWPAADLVNTVLPEAVSQTGSQLVYPASMANIDDNTILYVDGAGTPEIVPVNQVGPTGFLATFNYPHNAGATVTCSSLVNRQLRQTYRTPIANILAVIDAGAMIVDQPWGIATQTGAAYQILRMFITIDPMIKMVMFCIDPVLGFQLEVNVPQGRLMAADPWRQASNDPVWLVDNEPNACSNQFYELYPPPTTARQYAIIYATQWPDMHAPGDRPPPFINPSVLIHGALSDAFRTKLSAEDIFVDPRAADHYEQRWTKDVSDIIYADNHKSNQAMSFMYTRAFGLGGNSNYWQSHTSFDDGGGGGW